MEMIAGSDDLLSFLDKGKQGKVRIKVIPSEKPRELTGYADPKYMSRVFKEEVGVLPTEYRKSVH